MMGRYPHFTGRPTHSDEKACEEAMRLFDIWNFAERNYLTLSGGEKQRTHFARVMAQIWYPHENFDRCLILDEPLTFLDVHYQFNFMHILIEKIRRQSLVVVGVLHDLNLAARFADQLILIYHGKIISSGSVKEVYFATGLAPLCFKKPARIMPRLYANFTAKVFGR